MVTAGSGWAVNVDGAVYPAAWWSGLYVPAAGDNVRVLLCSGEANVLGPVAAAPRAPTGTVAGAASGGLLPVTVGSATVQCRYIGTEPSVGTLVLLSWQSTTPWVIGSAATYTAPTSPSGPNTGPSAPPATTGGTLTLSAIDSGTWTNTWWSRDVRQGTYGSVTYLGAWFYGSAPNQLAGATITGCRLRLGSRLNIGSYNSAITAHVWRVTQGAKSGAPTYADGPQDFALAAHSGAVWVTLPASVGQNLVNAGSGGMGINGSGYGGVVGIDTDPASGQLALDWTR